MVVYHHLPFLGHKVEDHQRARGSLQGPSLEDTCDLRGLSTYGTGPLEATTRALVVQSTAMQQAPAMLRAAGHAAYYKP